MLTDLFAIDIQVHYGRDSPVRQFLFNAEDGYSPKGPKKFFKMFNALSADPFNERAAVQWVVKDTAHCFKYSLVHMITDEVCLTGSFNSSCLVCCASWKHLVALQTTEEVCGRFCWRRRVIGRENVSSICYRYKLKTFPQIVGALR